MVFWAAIFVSVALWASTAVVSDTTAGQLYHLYGDRPFEEQPIPLATLTLSFKEDLDSISLHQSETTLCSTSSGCIRDPESRKLWLIYRFKDNSQAIVRLTDVEKRRIEFLYQRAKPSVEATTRVLTHGRGQRPILVKTFPDSRPSYPTVSDPRLISKVLGFYIVRVFASETKRLSKTSDISVTTLIEAESVR